ncbi:hypothetical protein [Solidesulfovibrio carbinolicus]|uniref:hypothetical protein n=1 Tax=Solidesulfovibrio carbinolicus TaxID=296842 RepID=UPI001010828C|nr:hypothetical protein [Solidesulfovibrio carbinolicus]
MVAAVGKLMRHAGARLPADQRRTWLTEIISENQNVGNDWRAENGIRDASKPQRHDESTACPQTAKHANCFQNNYIASALTETPKGNNMFYWSIR